jgi:hypothetical protein
MSGFEMFCERCGKRYGSEEATAAASPTLARRLLNAVGVSASVPSQSSAEPFLRFCLACRGYSCPSCWNDDAGFCQTCVPMPEVEVIVPELPVEPMPAFAFAAEPMVQPEDEPISIAARLFELEPTAEVEPAAEPEPVSAAEIEPVPEPEPVFAAALEPETEPEPELVMAAEPEPEFEPALAATIEAAPELPPTFAQLEPPNEAAFADMAFAEPEPDVHWDWSMDEAPEPTYEEPAPQPAVELPVAAELQVSVELPVAAEQVSAGVEIQVAADEVPSPTEAIPPQQPVIPAPPIFRPLEPMGPILPPPPPPAPFMPLPRLEFDLPAAPPAFVIARPDPNLAPRPILPAGLFEGPGPTVRPCPNCELPVSARARFCRRCGSAQG